MKLITELVEEVKYISEAKENGEKNLYIEGIFLQSAVKNRNGRIYPEEVMDKEVARYIKESVDNNTAVGELGHPDSPAINLNRISHKIVSLKKEGTNYIGKALITNTSMGKEARGLIESGVKLGVSSRGMGTLKKNSEGINEVQSDFRLATAADIVADPSAPEAWVNGIMEGVEWFYNDNGVLCREDLNLAFTSKEQIAEVSKKEIEEAVATRTFDEAKALQLFESYINRLTKIIK